MKRYINTEKLKSNMYKKISLFLLLFVSLFSIGFSATQTISSCPTSWNSGDTYVLDVNFIGNNCVINNNSILITTNNLKLDKDLIFKLNNANNIEFSNNNIKSLKIELLNDNTFNLNISNNNIYNQTTYLIYKVNTNVFSPSKDYYLNNLELNNNSIITYNNIHSVIRNICSGNNNGNNGLFWRLNINSSNINNNDILGFQYFTGISNDCGQASLVDLGITRIFKDVIFKDNVFIFSVGLFGSSTEISGTCNINLNNNNFLGHINTIDTNLDFLDDSVTTISNGGCNYLNSQLITKKNLNKESNSQVYSYFANSPNYYESNKKIYVPNNKVLDGLTTTIDLTNVQNTIIDLTYGSLTLNNIKTIKLGNNNGLDGGIGIQKLINVGQQIPVTYTDFYSTDYHLIDYTNNALINNINFGLNFNGVSVLRKNSVFSDGINLKFTNNIVDLNMVPNSELQPMLVFGCKAVITGNTFDMFNIQNQSVFGDGRCNSGGTQISGGHLIQDNTFTRGGIALRNLYSASGGGAINLVSKFNHNSFTRLSTGVYAKPIGDFNLNIVLPEVNASYFFKTSCQNYNFNLGNYYESVFDNAVALGLTDTNGDGIYDQNLNFQVTDSNSVAVFDKRALTSYPYNFAGQLANNNGVTNTCGSLSFNVIEPQNNYNYPSLSTFNTNWEYSSTTYSNLECSENLNGEVTLFNGVNSGINKGVTYGITDGTGSFEVQCCNTASCDDLKFNSNIIPFQVGTSTNPLIVSTNPVINNNPFIGNGNTGGGGNNNTGGGNNNTGGGNVTTGDFVDIQVIDFNSISNTNDNTVGFIQDIMGFVVNLGIPMAILIVVILSFLAVLRLLI